MESSEMNSCKPSFLSYRGRARRRTWWCATLVIGLIAAVAMFIAVWPLLCAIANGGMDDLEAVLSAHGFGLLLASAIGIVAFFLLLPVNVRRLHDRNMSGWWLLAFWIGNAIPCVGVLVGIAQFVIMGCLDGTPGTNRYGANPKGVE